MSLQYLRDYPRVTTLEGARKFLEKFENREHDHPCCHGHFSCSTHNSGPCLDETLADWEDALEAADADDCAAREQAEYDCE